jgi:hypothetical protein
MIIFRAWGAFESGKKPFEADSTEMAEIIGKAVGSIVRYEKHGDALNQDQLIALSNAGFDVFYITFGLRADTLSEPEHEIVTAYRSLGDDAKAAFVKMVKAYVAQ